MSIITRATLFAWLAIALAHVPLPERAGPVEDGAVPDAEVVRVPNVPYPATSGVRTYLPDVLLDFGSATFAAAAAAAPGVDNVSVTASVPARPGAAFDAAVLLPPSRAPPTLS